MMRLHSAWVIITHVLHNSACFLGN